MGGENVRPRGRPIVIVLSAGAPVPAAIVKASLGLRLAIPVSDPREIVGLPAGVTGFEGGEGGPVPVALVAVTVNV